MEYYCNHQRTILKKSLSVCAPVSRGVLFIIVFSYFTITFWPPTM